MSRTLKVAHLSDQEFWIVAIDAVSTVFSQLSRQESMLIDGLAHAVYSCKEKLHSIIATANAGMVCAACGGECCRTGKYHFTLVDLLVYLVKDKALFTPRFEQREGCPYLGTGGCVMEPGFRPLNCISFNCDQVESLLAIDHKERLSMLERELRQIYRTFEEHLGRRHMAGLLMHRVLAAGASLRHNPD